MRCWECGKEQETFSGEKVSFRAICERCGAYLHCCRNCRNYKPGSPNDCSIPGTEYIADRERGNFCEDFSLLGQGPADRKEALARAKKLWGEEKNEEDPPKERFKSLFKNE